MALFPVLTEGRLEVVRGPWAEGALWAPGGWKTGNVLSFEEKAKV